MRSTALVVAALLLPTGALATPRPQVVPQVELVGVFARKPALSVGAEVALSGRFPGDPHRTDARVHDVYTRVRWDPGTGQVQVGAGLRGGVDLGGHSPNFGGWTPGLAALADVGVLGRRFGGPALSLGGVVQTSLVGGAGAGGARFGVTLHLRDDVAPHQASRDGRVDEVELAVRGGVYALRPSRADLFLLGSGTQDVPPREFD